MIKYTQIKINAYRGGGGGGGGDGTCLYLYQENTNDFGNARQIDIYL